MKTKASENVAAYIATFPASVRQHPSHGGADPLPLSEPVPVRLIERLAKFRAKEVVAREKAKPLRRKRR
jgi:hypothetical protein